MKELRVNSNKKNNNAIHVLKVKNEQIIAPFAHFL